MDFVKKFDGSDRTPRDVQKLVLNWLSQNWLTTDDFIIKAPVAVGKSAMARAIQIVTGAHVITPSNLLVDQYNDIYPTVNVLKGKAHYHCETSGLDCRTWTSECQMKPCQNCPYIRSRENVLNRHPTFFNPMSMYYMTRDQAYIPPKVVIVDEAHTLPSMLSMLCTKSFFKTDYDFTAKTASETHLCPWLEKVLGKLKVMFDQYKSLDPKYAAAVNSEMETLRLVLRGLNENPQNYAVYIENGFRRGRPDKVLKIQPIDPPAFLISALLRGQKRIFMSATLFENDVKLLTRGRPYLELDVPSPIPKDSRKIFYQPIDGPVNKDTDPQVIADAIEEVLKANEGKNTIIHTTYSMSLKLASKFSRPILVNTQENKAAMVDKFCQEGGVFLASGCAEGLDLRGDLCRINIIPKLSYPNMGDPVVKKKMSAEGGQEWYMMETMKTLIQQVGRSTRTVDDHSKTYILDPGFARLFSTLSKKKILPISFTESIIWHKE